MPLEVSQLTVYPLKSAQGIHLDTMQLGDRGPHLDRRWMLINQHGKFVTQRQHPTLCLIHTELLGETLRLTKPNAASIDIPAAGDQQHQSNVWGSAVSGHDCGDEAADYLGSYLGFTCRLIYMPENFSRVVDANYAKNRELVGYADGFPILITTQESLDDFNRKLGYQIGMERFRPNIVVSGGDAYAEDQWQIISINDIEFSLVKPCSRCIMPSVNPETAKKEMQVNQTLMQYRRRDRKTYFGQNALYNKLGRINVGDRVQVLVSSVARATPFSDTGR